MREYNNTPVKLIIHTVQRKTYFVNYKRCVDCYAFFDYKSFSLFAKKKIDKTVECRESAIYIAVYIVRGNDVSASFNENNET